MKLKIISLHNHGDFAKEYVLMQAQEDCDIGRYAIADSTYIDVDHVSNKLRHFHWFKDKEIKKGEYVSLWTGKGTEVTSKTDAGVPLHRLYWGLETAVWNNTGDCAVLFEINTWQFFPGKKIQ